MSISATVFKMAERYKSVTVPLKWLILYSFRKALFLELILKGLTRHWWYVHRLYFLLWTSLTLVSATLVGGAV